MPPGMLQEVVGASWTTEDLPGEERSSGKNQAEKRAWHWSDPTVTHYGSAVDLRGTVSAVDTSIGEPSACIWSCCTEGLLISTAGGREGQGGGTGGTGAQHDLEP